MELRFAQRTLVQCALDCRRRARGLPEHQSLDQALHGGARQLFSQLLQLLRVSRGRDSLKVSPILRTGHAPV